MANKRHDKKNPEKNNKTKWNRARNMMKKRWAKNDNESGGQDSNNNDSDNMDDNVGANDTVDSNVVANISYSDNVDVNMSDHEDVTLNISDMDIISVDDMDVTISENVDVNMSDLSDGEEYDCANASQQGHLVITDEGPRSSTPCGPRKSSKGPSRKHPYEPRRPRRTGWLDVMRQSKRSSARLRRESIDEPILLDSVDLVPGSGTSTSADPEARGFVPNEPGAAAANSRHPLRDDMIRMTQENATCVLPERTRSAVPPRADNNQNIDHELRDSKLVKTPKPSAGKSA